MGINIRKTVELHYCLRVLKSKRGDQQKDVLQDSLVVTSGSIELLSKGFGFRPGGTRIRPGDVMRTLVPPVSHGVHPSHFYGTVSHCSISGVQDG